MLKDIINKAREGDEENIEASKHENIKVRKHENIKARKNKSKKDMERRVMNLQVPVAVRNYWMSQIKAEGKSFRWLIIEFMIKKYGLPENWKKDDL